MFAKISEYLTQQLENEKVISSDKRDLYRYGFQNGMILILNFVTSLIIGVLFDQTWECIVILLAYMPLRSYAGGYHAKSSEKCYVSSSAIMIIWMGLLKNNVFSTSCCVVMLVIGVCVCLFFMPVESENKPFDKHEQRIYRKFSVIILAVESCIGFLLIFALHMFNAVVPLAIFTEAIMLVIGKIVLTKR